MRQYRIQGGNRLAGELSVGGSKNAVLPILAALCLNESETVINNCPRIADTFVSIDILKGIGCEAEFNENTLRVDSTNIQTHVIPRGCVSKMRSSILFMGAMLAKKGKVNISLPGGCKLGKRAIDLHISGLTAMGASIREEDKMLICRAEKLRGAHINLHTPSVGATENLMIAAARAMGETIIENAACEPEIVDLARFLKGMGAQIKGEGTGTIIIKGVDKLSSTAPHEIMPDRIVAGTYLVAAAMTQGNLTLKNVDTTDLTPISETLTAMGCTLHATKTEISLTAPPRLKALPLITTGAHPGFPTDMQAQFVAATAIADGIGTIKETIFEERYQHAHELNQMGAEIALWSNNKTFVVYGKERLKGRAVAAHDLRGGAAMILAGLCAEGETIVKNAEYVERGYESIERDLSHLGADIILEECQA